jgi:hypothetical protein
VEFYHWASFFFKILTIEEVFCCKYM